MDETSKRLAAKTTRGTEIDVAKTKAYAAPDVLSLSSLLSLFSSLMCLSCSAIYRYCADALCSQYLLASKGFNLDNLSRNLTSIDLRRTFEPQEALAETDLDGFLRHEHEMLLLTAIEEAKQEVSFIK